MWTADASSRFSWCPSPTRKPPRARASPSRPTATPGNTRRRRRDPIRPRSYSGAGMSLELGDPLAHRALQALLRAESAVRRRLAAELERAGISAAGFSALVVLTTAGGTLELKTLRRRLGGAKRTGPEVTAPGERRGRVVPPRPRGDRGIVVVDLTPAGRDLVERL